MASRITGPRKTVCSVVHLSQSSPGQISHPSNSPVGGSVWVWGCQVIGVGMQEGASVFDASEPRPVLLARTP